MKKLLILLSLFGSIRVAGQTQEAKQLLLNMEKLTQLKSILQTMKKGWEVAEKGYTTIRDIGSGSFKLHKGFLDELLQVSPSVRKYKRIADIIQMQSAIIRQTRSSLAHFKIQHVFSANERNYINVVLNNLLRRSAEHADGLLLIILPGKLRMDDAERLESIDLIYHGVSDQLSFLKDFIKSTNYLAIQRKSEMAEAALSRRLGGQ